MIEAPDDQTNVYTGEEERALTEQLLEITRQVHKGAILERPLGIPLVCDLHRALFHNVRDHAGKYRKKGWGSETLVFGPHRSSHRDDVEAELKQIFDRARREEDALVAESESYELEAIRLAVRVHAELIWIHPFQDGNGRVGRLIAQHVLVRKGLRPVPMEAVKREYTEALNEYYTRGNIEPLVDLYVSLNPVGR